MCVIMGHIAMLSFWGVAGVWRCSNVTRRAPVDA